jgi:hypothetical protein
LLCGGSQLLDAEAVSLCSAFQLSSRPPNRVPGTFYEKTSKQSCGSSREMAGFPKKWYAWLDGEILFQFEPLS